MSEMLLDAQLIVGGLWDSAPVRLDEACDGVIKTRGDGTLHVAFYVPWQTPPGGYVDTCDSWDSLELRLPGPLGLGADGLAVRIAERLGHDPDLPGFHRVRFVHGLKKTEWLPKYALSAARYPGFLARISAYLVMTDALCATTGLELEAGEVAIWEPLGGGWELRTKTGTRLFLAHASAGDLVLMAPALATTGDDAHASLKACWEARRLPQSAANEGRKAT